MRFTVNVDCTPEEARAFFGMPDVAPFNAMIVDEMSKRAKDNMDALADPERFVRQWMELGGRSFEAFQALFTAAMAGGAAGAAPGGATGAGEEAGRRPSRK